MLTGVLPFPASDPAELIYSHIAKEPPPIELDATIPVALSALVLKLLAKAPEDRYQTARGVAADLRHCLAELRATGRIEPLALGTSDATEQLRFPERLYGREADQRALLGPLARAAAGGAGEIVLVTGHAGVGKSALVEELRSHPLGAPAFFAWGKADQSRHVVPHAPFVQGLRGVLRVILGCSDVELSRWRDALRARLGIHGQLLIGLLPELELVIGAQSPVLDVPPAEAKWRFHIAISRLLGLLAGPEHPLVMFLDDLQWADAATLDLFEHVVIHERLPHLLVVVAYRDDELASTHHLARILDALVTSGARMTEIRLAPLSGEVVVDFLTDTLVSDPERVRSLARLVHEKTNGNPFFARQFVASLHENRLLRFESATRMWRWDDADVRGEHFTDNVVRLMMERFRRLPLAARTVLQALACLGKIATSGTLAAACAADETEIHQSLAEPVRVGLIARGIAGYAFLHDRIEEASYAVIPPDERTSAHLLIARRLLARTPVSERHDAIFDIVNQYNIGSALLESGEERGKLAELNLLAAKRAMASSAYASALVNLKLASSLLSQHSWSQDYQLTFAIYLALAECELAGGDRPAAEKRLADLSSHAAGMIDISAVVCVQLRLLTNAGRFADAVAIGLSYLRRGPLDWPSEPTDQEVSGEYNRLLRLLGERPIDSLVDLPPMTDPVCRASMDVLAGFVSPSYFVDRNLNDLTSIRMVVMSLESGNTDASAMAYSLLSPVIGRRFGSRRDGYQFGNVGFALVRRGDMSRFRTQVLLVFAGWVQPWTQSLHDVPAVFDSGFSAAVDAGDMTYAAYHAFFGMISELNCARSLESVQKKAETGREFARGASFHQMDDFFCAPLGLIRTLRGQTPSFGAFSDASFDQEAFEARLGCTPLGPTAAFYWIRKLQALFYAGRYSEASDASERARSLKIGNPHPEEAELHFYSALTHAAVAAKVGMEGGRHMDAIVAHRRQLASWAEDGKETFQCQVALVDAEIARLESRELHAERQYDAAIRLAREHGFLQHEALANELAGRFQLGRGFETMGHAFLREARDAYERWGAIGNVRQLGELFPALRSDRAVNARTPTLASLDELECAAVIGRDARGAGDVHRREPSLRGRRARGCR